MFITQQDYNTEIRSEVLELLDPTENKTALAVAEQMALDQIKQYISGRYDTAAIFSRQEDDRDMFMVMIAIDCALYHLWSKKAPKKMPEIRAQRYQDALDWLKMVAAGDLMADLPVALVEDDNTAGIIIIESKYKPDNNKY